MKSTQWTPFQPVSASITRGGLPVGALNGVRSRRLVAVCLDLILVSILSLVLWTGLLVLTFGLSLLLLPPLFPFVAFFYNGLSVSGPRMATFGMRAADLEMRLEGSGGRVPFINAAVHAVLFYVSWMFPPVFLLSLVTADKRCLHDILSGVIFVRRI
ncbi:RDD family protein [Lichenihabitans sp. PAMC28606]|uniref:RDD family protein n=1 Tax=Lichenihabitans sp. PAMC28606 TaxID=2880932 RepID=UPI001D0A318A|nr:RDD family protein [Lichenihabitans sp. PAMC28606]UDL95395.1 RDD family protein [Lichenihabitans sp. PAMC28606]